MRSQFDTVSGFETAVGECPHALTPHTSIGRTQIHLLAQPHACTHAVCIIVCRVLRVALGRCGGI